MKKTKTARGFAIAEFLDSHGNKCSIQKSSAAERDYIWLGANEIGLKGFVPYRQPSAWQDISEEEIKNKFGVESVIANNRIHLDRKTVKKLLPHLIKFVETGEI